ncbi:MAG TPA: DUF922 domain-containing protein [Usitatibacter sp.]|nr:DUF922 domain-containing protein [Usitatibacter sp.]
MLAMSAQAQVHMCKDANGRKVYSDAPCGADDKVVDIKSPTGGPQIKPNANLEIVHYDIRGATWEALRREMQAKGPEGGWGASEKRISYKYLTRQTQKGCAIDAVTVYADSAISLPNWVDRYNAPVSLQDWWDAASRSIDMHERTHVQFTLDAARDLERVLKTMPDQPTCEGLNALAVQQYTQILADHDQKQRDYDARTDHGWRERTPYRP